MRTALLRRAARIRIHCAILSTLLIVSAAAQNTRCESSVTITNIHGQNGQFSLYIKDTANVLLIAQNFTVATSNGVVTIPLSVDQIGQPVNLKSDIPYRMTLHAYSPSGAPSTYRLSLSDDLEFFDTTAPPSGVLAPGSLGGDTIGFVIHPRSTCSATGNTGTNSRSATITVAGSILSVTPTTTPGPLAAVTNVFNGSTDEVAFIDTQTNLVLGYAPTSGTFTHAVTFTPDGAQAWAADDFGNQIVVIDSATRAIRSPIPFTTVRAVAFHPDGNVAYAVSEGGIILVIDVATRSVTSTIDAGQSSPYKAIPDQPYFINLAITRDGNRAYLADVHGSVGVLDTTTNTVIKRIPALGDPTTNSIQWATLTTDGVKVYVTNAGSKLNVFSIDVPTNQILGVVSLGGFPRGIAMAPDGSKAYIANEGGYVSVLNLSNDTVTTTVPVGNGGGRGISVTPDGARAYVTAGSTVAVMNTATNLISSYIAVQCCSVQLAIQQPRPPARLSSGFTILAGSPTTGSVNIIPLSPSFMWTAVSNAPWIKITSVASGTGAGTISFSVDANFTGSDRRSTALIGGEVFTIIQQAVPPPSLSIAKIHSGSFTQGQTNASYTLTVSNGSAAGTTVGTVTVTDTLPSGLSLSSMSGLGWSCTANVCTRSDALAGGASYPVITVAVNVSGIATSPQVNQVSVSGGGSASATASDSTTVIQPTLSLNRPVLNFGINGSLVTSPQTILVTIAGGVNAAWTATSDHSNISVNPASGVGTATFQVSAATGSGGIVTVTAPGAIGSPKQVQVNVASVTPAAPFGSFDTPLANTTGVVGAIPVTGWALDNVEVTHVDIFREPIVGEASGNLVFIGTAVFSADARPDVATQFPAYPNQYRAGWGYQMLTNFLPNASGSGASGNGTYKLHAIAFDKGGLQTDLGTRTITVDNAHAAKPFGTIDTPTQGGTVSGADYVNFGWALTPQVGIIPTDGSTITVVIDGVSVGHPTYNQFRSDIANLFPSYANSGGAVGFFHINTTTLTNGVHTISWNAFDNLGRGEGLGSRYFTALNTGGVSGAAAPEVIDESVAGEGVRVRHGLSLNHRPEPIAQDADGAYSVTMEEVGHIELHLGAASGSMLVQDEVHALPIGSTLKGGVFYWQPGPGFLGDYTMQFERPDGTRIPVRIKIVPKRF